MIHPVALFYGVLCALTLWSTLHSRPQDRLDAQLAGVALSIGCFLSNVAWATNAIENWVPVDAAVMIAALAVLWRTLRVWTLVLAALAVTTMGVHALADSITDRGVVFMYVYPAALNAIFVLQLLCVASNGAKGAKDHGTAWLVFSWPRRSGGHSGRVRGLADNFGSESCPSK